MPVRINSGAAALCGLAAPYASSTPQTDCFNAYLYGLFINIEVRLIKMRCGPGRSHHHRTILYTGKLYSGIVKCSNHSRLHNLLLLLLPVLIGCNHGPNCTAIDLSSSSCGFYGSLLYLIENCFVKIDRQFGVTELLHFAKDGYNKPE